MLQLNLAAVRLASTYFNLKECVCVSVVFMYCGSVPVVQNFRCCRSAQGTVNAQQLTYCSLVCHHRDIQRVMVNFTLIIWYIPSKIGGIQYDSHVLRATECNCRAVSCRMSNECVHCTVLLTSVLKLIISYCVVYLKLFCKLYFIGCLRELRVVKLFSNFG